MTTITKEKLIESLQHRISVASGFPESEKAQIDLDLARIALASLEAEAIAVRARWKDEGHGHGDWKYYNIAHLDALMADETRECELVYSTTPAKVSVPDSATAIRACIDEFPESVRDVVEECASIAENACRAAMIQGSEPETTTCRLPFERWLSQQNEPIDVDCGCVTTEAFYHWLRVAYEAGNSPVIPDELLSAIRKVARIRADFDDFDGDRRGIGDCLDEAEQELIVTINKHASVIAAAAQQKVNK